MNIKVNIHLKMGCVEKVMLTLVEFMFVLLAFFVLLVNKFIVIAMNARTYRDKHFDPYHPSLIPAAFNIVVSNTPYILFSLQNVNLSYAFPLPFSLFNIPGPAFHLLLRSNII